MKSLLNIAVVLLVLLVGVISAQPTLFPITSDVVQNFLNAHNAVRANVNPAATTPIPALTWDVDNLQAKATAVAQTCIFAHSGSSNGENLAGGSTGGSFTRAGWETTVTNAWAAEVADYNIFANTCSKVCGHYTQIVWAQSRQIGCARIDNCPTLPQTIIVCQYFPAGNVNGRVPYTPLTAVTSPSTSAGIPSTSNSGLPTLPPIPSVSSSKAAASSPAGVSQSPIVASSPAGVSQSPVAASSPAGVSRSPVVASSPAGVSASSSKAVASSPAGVSRSPVAASSPAGVSASSSKAVASSPAGVSRSQAAASSVVVGVSQSQAAASSVVVGASRSVLPSINATCRRSCKAEYRQCLKINRLGRCNREKRACLFFC